MNGQLGNKQKASVPSLSQYSNRGLHVLELLALDKLDPAAALEICQRGRAQDSSHFTSEASFIAACQAGDLCTVKVMLCLSGSLQVDVHADDEAAFIAACENGHADVVRELLALSGDRCINTQVRNGKALTVACCAGHLGVLDELLALDDSRALAVHVDEGAALLAACQHGHVAVVIHLLRTLDVTKLSARAVKRVVDAACAQGHASVLRALWSVVRVHSPEAVCMGSWLKIAAEKGHSEIIRVLFRFIRRLGPQACSSGSIDASSSNVCAAAFQIACTTGHRDCAWAILEEAEGLEMLDLEIFWWGAIEVCVISGLSDLLHHLLAIFKTGAGANSSTSGRNAFATYSSNGGSQCSEREHGTLALRIAALITLMVDEHKEVLLELVEYDGGIPYCLGKEMRRVLSTAIDRRCRRVTRWILSKCHFLDSRNRWTFFASCAAAADVSTRARSARGCNPRATSHFLTTSDLIQAAVDSDMMANAFDALAIAQQAATCNQQDRPSLQANILKEIEEGVLSSDVDALGAVTCMTTRTTKSKQNSQCLAFHMMLSKLAEMGLNKCKQRILVKLQRYSNAFTPSCAVREFFLQGEPARASALMDMNFFLRWQWDCLIPPCIDFPYSDDWQHSDSCHALRVLCKEFEKQTQDLGQDKGSNGTDLRALQVQHDNRHVLLWRMFLALTDPLAAPPPGQAGNAHRNASVAMLLRHFDRNSCSGAISTNSTTTLEFAAPPDAAWDQCSTRNIVFLTIILGCVLPQIGYYHMNRVLLSHLVQFRQFFQAQAHVHPIKAEHLTKAQPDHEVDARSLCSGRQSHTTPDYVSSNRREGFNQSSSSRRIHSNVPDMGIVNVGPHRTARQGVLAALGHGYGQGRFCFCSDRPVGQDTIQVQLCEQTCSCFEHLLANFEQSDAVQQFGRKLLLPRLGAQLVDMTWWGVQVDARPARREACVAQQQPPPGGGYVHVSGGATHALGCGTPGVLTRVGRRAMVLHRAARRRPWCQRDASCGCDHGPCAEVDAGHGRQQHKVRRRA